MEGFGVGGVLFVEGQDRFGFAGAFPVHSLAGVRGDAEEPGFLGGVVTERGPGALGVEEYLLDESFRFVAIAAEPRCDRVERSGVFVGEPLDRVAGRLGLALVMCHAVRLHCGGAGLSGMRCGSVSVVVRDVIWR